MAEHSEWVGEPGRPGRWGRLAGPGGDRPSPVAFVLAVAAAVAFVGSLASDWISVTGSLSGPRDSESGLIYGADVAGGTGGAITIGASNNVTSLIMLGLIYGLGGLALLVLAAAVLNRPDLALRIRMPVAGLGAGVVAVVVASLIRLPTILLSQNVALSGFGRATNIVRAYQPGLFCAFAVGILAVAAVWVRSMPAARSAARSGTGSLVAGPVVELPPLAEASAAARGPEPANAPAPVEPAAWSRFGTREVTRDAAREGSGGTRENPGGWSRRDEPAAPYDLTVTSED